MKIWKIYSIIITIILILVIIGICIYAFIFKENITELEAKNIAFEHANVDESNITISSINKDIADRTYEIHFFDDTYEYEADINYNNGDIRSFEKDIKPNANNIINSNSTNVNNATNNINTSNSNNTNINATANYNYIGVEMAREIALEHAGLNNSDVKFNKVDLDINHSVDIYEVEFYYNNMEYDYEINATTGEILKYESAR